MPAHGGRRLPRGTVVSQKLEFGHVAVLAGERSLLVDGAPVVLGARAFDVLLALAERCDRVVSKAELLDLAWPGLVVEENNLTVQISALRRLLGHEAIATVTGRGYRLALAATGKPQAALAAVQAPGHQPAARLLRRLATVVQADVMDWARLVERDAAAAAGAWKRVRNELIERDVPRYGGRLIELTAERVQIEFGSAVESVDWSLALQRALASRRGALTDTSALHMRIGIAVDDVLVDDGKLVGDGVNVAADLHLSAGHDDVLVTQKVRDFAYGKLDARFEPLGERLMRRTRRPMQVFRALSSIDATARAAARPRQAVQMATLAVLPFASDVGSDPYFGDGITEEIIAALSLNRALFVIAHGSTLHYRSRQDDLAAVADELGVRYLLTGSVRQADTQLRIHVRLLHAADQRILWQQRYDGSSADVFSFQSEIAARVAAAVAPPLQDEEVARVRSRPTEHYGAYDCVLRALAGIYQLGSAEFVQAGDLLRRAIEIDPDYAQAHAHLAWWYSLASAEGRAALQGVESRLALDHAMQAVRLDGRDAWALSVAGYMLSLQKQQHTQALELYEQALSINPSCAAAWARSGATLSYLGRCDEALNRVQQAMRLSPFDQHLFWYYTICGSACFGGGRYDESVAWLGKALRLNPRYNGARRFLIGALVQTGELAEARALAQELLDELPDFSVRQFGQWSPLQQPMRDKLLQALETAGLPP